MRAVVQRVSSAHVEISGSICGSIGPGLLVFLGAGPGDSQAECLRLARKIAAIRIFSDNGGKMNLSVDDIAGEFLVISQFTLFADCRKGNRPSFAGAMESEAARKLYEYFLNELQKIFPGRAVKSGQFGADMKVSLVNDGPVTILLDTQDL